MKYVYVKDSEGFVSKKAVNKVEPDDVVITKDEFRKLSGDEYYEQNFTHGGRREGAGRKPKFTHKLEYQIRVSEEEKAFIAFARENHFDYGKAMRG
jgi:hypothetical protein